MILSRNTTDHEMLHETQIRLHLHFYVETNSWQIAMKKLFKFHAQMFSEKLHI